ncbi:13292_t:CDS:2, partial [Gigaspora margarita]
KKRVCQVTGKSKVPDGAKTAGTNFAKNTRRPYRKETGVLPLELQRNHSAVTEGTVVEKETFCRRPKFPKLLGKQMREMELRRLQTFLQEVDAKFVGKSCSKLLWKRPKNHNKPFRTNHSAAQKGTESLRGRDPLKARGTGPVEGSNEAVRSDKIICVVETKQNLLGIGVAQNIMQCKSACNVNQPRQKTQYERGEFEYVYGITTTATEWYFLLYGMEGIYATTKTEFCVSLTEDNDPDTLHKEVKRVLEIVVEAACSGFRMLKSRSCSLTTSGHLAPPRICPSIINVSVREETDISFEELLVDKAARINNMMTNLDTKLGVLQDDIQVLRQQLLIGPYGINQISIVDPNLEDYQTNNFNVLSKS